MILAHNILLSWGQGVGSLLALSQNKRKSINPEAPPRASQATLSNMLIVDFKLDTGELGNEQTMNPASDSLWEIRNQEPG